MSADGKFIVQFIAESSKKGLEALDAAKQEIEDIDTKLSTAEKLKLRRVQLIGVLDHFGDDSYRRRRTVNTPVSEDINYNSDEILDLRQKIKDVVEAEGPINVSDIIKSIASYDHDILIMRALKWMGDNDIVTRDDQGRVKPGANWNES